MSEATASKRYPVLIAGAGPVGLSLAIELAYRGIRCLVVEQSDGSVEFPTTNLANTRTVEHLRRWGIADRMRFESGYPTDYPRNYLFVTRMDGYEIARFDHPANGDPAARSPYSPEGRLWISKPYFDPVLHQHANSLPTVEIRYETSFESFRQDGGQVFAEIVDKKTGRHETIEADYLVGCDGGRSNIRRALDIQFQGVFSQGMNVAVLFRAPLLTMGNHGAAVQYQIINSQINGAIAAVDGKDLWRLNIRNVKQEQLDVLNAPEKLRAALGETIDFELLAMRPWTGHCVVAERYREGRVFLAGDAAHLNWPAGGFGMNTGVGDAVDIGWKLAAVLEGWGGAKLLDSYNSERKPIAMINVNEAAEMRASFDNQTPFSPQIEKTATRGNRFVRKPAPRSCAPVPRNFSTTRRVSNWATAMKTRPSAFPTARRRLNWITEPMCPLLGRVYGLPMSGLEMADRRWTCSAKASRYWIFPRSKATRRHSPPRHPKLACR